MINCVHSLMLVRWFFPFTHLTFFFLPSLWFPLHDLDPPGEINVRVNLVTHRSLTIEIVEQDEINPISGYLVNYKTNSDDWEEVKILGQRKNFLLEDLKCGTKYTISIVAFNKAGPSHDNQLVHSSTSGNGK